MKFLFYIDNVFTQDDRWSDICEQSGCRDLVQSFLGGENCKWQFSYNLHAYIDGSSGIYKRKVVRIVLETEWTLLQFLITLKFRGMYFWISLRSIEIVIVFHDIELFRGYGKPCSWFQKGSIQRFMPLNIQNNAGNELMNSSNQPQKHVANIKKPNRFCW